MIKDISTKKKIDRLADKEYVKLGRFTGMLPSEDAEKKLGELVTVFGSVAKAYRRKADELIAQEQDLAARRYAHSQINARIRQHASLLSNLFQRFPPVSLGETRDELRQVINFLSTQLSSVDSTVPFLKPLISSKFSYIHFNYIKNAMGIISIPPELAVSPPDRYEDWSVLWHEIAGYAIASRPQEVSDWAEELAGVLDRIPGRWDSYRNVFLDSVAKTYERRQPEWLKIDVETIKEHLEKAHGEPRGKSEWEVDWLGEFFEDLFLIRVFVQKNQPPDQKITAGEKPAPIWALIDALSKAYPDFTTGDQIHPPPNLRVLVALAYLYQPFDKATFATEVTQFSVEGDRFQLAQASQDLALTIAKFCDEKVDQLFEKVSETELRLARLVLNLPQSPGTVTKGEIFQEMTATAASATPVAVELAQPFIKKIQEQTNLKDLLKLQFIDEDPDRFGPPFPPPML